MFGLVWHGWDGMVQSKAAKSINLLLGVFEVPEANIVFIHMHFDNRLFIFAQASYQFFQIFWIMNKNALDKKKLRRRKNQDKRGLRYAKLRTSFYS